RPNSTVLLNIYSSLHEMFRMNGQIEGDSALGWKESNLSSHWDSQSSVLQEKE
ncbi:Hypothetical predicted protein, partial [Marmota monax]